MSANTLVRFDDLTFKYDGAAAPVLQHLNLEIGEGSATVILGPNGAGKTTLLHLTLGWLKPAGGRVLLDGMPLAQYQRQELGRRMALVPQFENISFDFTLLEYVMLGRAPYLPPLAMPGEKDLEIGMHALKQVGMDDMADRSVGSISGGEKQRMLLARALAQQPRLLLLDEPSSHLDLGNKVRLVHILRELVKEGVTILMSTHEPDVASALATDVILMQEGKVIQKGPTQQVMTSDRLSHLYNQPLEVLDLAGRLCVVWHD